MEDPAQTKGGLSIPSLPYLCILVCLVIYDFGLVPLEHLLLACYPSPAYLRILVYLVIEDSG